MKDCCGLCGRIRSLPFSPVPKLKIELLAGVKLEQQRRGAGRVGAGQLAAEVHDGEIGAVVRSDGDHHAPQGRRAAHVVFDELGARDAVEQDVDRLLRRDVVRRALHREVDGLALDPLDFTTTRPSAPVDGPSLGPFMMIAPGSGWPGSLSTLTATSNGGCGASRSPEHDASVRLSAASARPARMRAGRPATVRSGLRKRSRSSNGGDRKEARGLRMQRRGIVGHCGGGSRGGEERVGCRGASVARREGVLLARGSSVRVGGPLGRRRGAPLGSEGCASGIGARASPIGGMHPWDRGSGPLGVGGMHLWDSGECPLGIGGMHLWDRGSAPLGSGGCTFGIGGVPPWDRGVRAWDRGEPRPRRADARPPPAGAGLSTLVRLPHALFGLRQRQLDHRLLVDRAAHRLRLASLSWSSGS